MQNFQDAVNLMRYPDTRNQTIQNTPSKFQQLIHDREQQFKFLGQDGSDTLHDLKKCIVENTPIPIELDQKLFELWGKLQAYMQ